MRPSIYRKALADQKWMVVGFGASLALMAMLVVFIWPSYRDDLAFFDIPPAFQAFLGELSIATPAGFLSAEFYSWIPILMLVYAVIQGTGALAGEEGAGTMDLLLAQPVSRSRVVLEKAAATVTGAALIVAIGYLGWLVSMPFVAMEPDPSMAFDDIASVTLADTLVANINLLPITLFFFGIALYAGAVAPSRAIAAGAVVGLATAAYFVQVLVNGVDLLEPLKYLTPFYYYGNGMPLVRGLNWPHVTLLLGIAAAFVALALHAFASRDISSGASDVSAASLLRRVFVRNAAA